ncbi:DUF7311 family protein [Halogeometricum limi]|uniref:DUF7311 domain-containing protein n=1 Tax=Halogeometricum limi TaxID=555875 RepID=A0A1I6G679_9EURY|nr:hypothetical protein [Halogeometricum limi]SFR37694.1 hypothetical protein SAMN04488124_0932 [Halogeometricum limi]
MIRVVLAAVLTTAVLGASLPAVEDARADRASTAVDADVERLSAAGSSLAHGSDPTRDPATAPTRTETVTLPPPTWSSAELAYVAVGGSPNGPGNRSVVTYAVDDGPETSRRLSLPLPISTPDGPVVLRGRGDRTVSLSLLTSVDGPVLVVGRGNADGR